MSNLKIGSFGIKKDDIFDLLNIDSDKGFITEVKYRLDRIVFTVVTSDENANNSFSEDLYTSRDTPALKIK